MNGKELKQVRTRLGLTQVGLAELLSVTPNTVARWERDEVGIKPAMAKLIQLVAAGALEQPKAAMKTKAKKA